MWLNGHGVSSSTSSTVCEQLNATDALLEPMACASRAAIARGMCSGGSNSIASISAIQDAGIPES
eukprot:2985319-Alexandrium_andersonii.AAC.1